MPSVAVDKGGVFRQKSKMDKVSIQQKVNRNTLLKYRYPGLFHSDYVRNPYIDILLFATRHYTR